MSKNILKQSIVHQLFKIIDQKISNAESAIRAATDSRDNETKSSAGDKYETGRAMMQIEQQKNEVQLSQAIVLKKRLEQINIDMDFDKADLGALVTTKEGQYFLSVGLGKIEIDNKKYFAISMASPLGKTLQGKRQGDQFVFMGRSLEILDLK